MIAGIYIDDAGTPGQESKSKYLHTDRKSWAAVIIPPEIQYDVRDAMNTFVDGVKQDFGADELHFTDIYSGRPPYKNVPLDKRGELIHLMSSLFEAFALPIIFQSSSPEHLKELQSKYDLRSDKLGWFSFSNHEHVSLLALCGQVAAFVREHKQSFPEPLPMMIDEGLVRTGTSIDLPAYADVIAGPTLNFRSTTECRFLQLADFAAFAIGRSQWLLGKGNLKDRDHIFLESVSADKLNIINLPRFTFDLEQHTTQEYDSLLQEDRAFKGFTDP